MATVPSVPGDVLELEVGAIAAGGGCVARVPDGRVVFVRHCLPGERVVARITAETTSFLRADAIRVVEASGDRVEPRCPHAGPGRCGGCDFQHVSLSAQRRLKEDLVAEQLARLAGLDLRVEVEAVDGAPDGLGWRTRMSFAVDADGGIGLRRHRSHDIEYVERCPIAIDAINDASVSSVSWQGARQLEIVASPDGGTPVARVETGRQRLTELPDLGVGLVWKGRTLRAPDHVEFDVDGNRFAVRPGVFWQVHPSAGPVLTRVVLDGLAARPGERVADLYSGAGLFTVALARVVGHTGVVVAVERSGPAVADLRRNTSGLAQVEIVRSDVSPALVSRRLGRPDLVVLDPARPGAGRPVMEALTALDPPPRRVAYVSCEPAPFARDLAVAFAAGWSLRSLRAFDLFPMTEHVELVGILEPPAV